MIMINEKHTVIDLFAGGGGLGLGFENAGFDLVAAYDKWSAAIRFFRKNIKTHPIYELDIGHEAAIEILQKNPADFIIGGPPCQDFSSAGNRKECKRASLTVAFAKIVAHLRPAYFLMENVERAKRSNAFAEAKQILKESGYGMTATVLDASLCGVPQRRKRLFLFGDLDGLDNQLIPYVIKAQSSRPMTLRDYFGDDLGVEYYYRHPRSYARRGIFSIDEPSPTIRGVNRPVPAGYPGHQGDPVPISPEIRPLTTKERSLIQTFPPTFDVSGPKSEIEQIVGNAVPVKLAEFVAERIQEYIKDKKMGRVYPNPDEPCTMQLELFEQKQKYGPEFYRKYVSLKNTAIDSGGVERPDTLYELRQK